ncbi:MAG: hypothetical protein V4625_20465 [Pseudomonadota bacterium]
MNAHALHDGNRHALTFSLHGLSAHDETLFKSFVRLLAHRTLQQWTFTPAAASADVHVTSQATAHEIAQGHKALVVGPTHHGEPYFVSIPFHADALEQTLNNLGTVVEADRQVRISVPRPTNSATQFRLLRWPTSNLLTSTAHMRLATMMTGKWTTLASLQERSGVPVQVCTQFIADLQHAGLLADAATAAPATAAPVAPEGARAGSPRHVEAGLISRIRSRLGLFSAGRT